MTYRIVRTALFPYLAIERKPSLDRTLATITAAVSQLNAVAAEADAQIAAAEDAILVQNMLIINTAVTRNRATRVASNLAQLVA